MPYLVGGDNIFQNSQVFPPASFNTHLTMTPLPLATPFPLSSGLGTFTP